MKLLIAEDDLTSRTILTAVTKKWGFEPIVTEDGEQAWEELQKLDTPNLLLIDWEMPRLNGVELCMRIRQKATKTPPFIILLTARSGTDNIVNGLDAGANDYIAKPFANSELLARLKVGQRMLELQHELNTTQNELLYEKAVIENIVLKMRASKSFYYSGLRVLDSPVEKTSGDVLLSSFCPNKSQYIMLGDFTGHGLMAAVGGPIVYDIFYTMASKGLPIQEIAIEINKQLLEKMPTGLFMGAIFIELKECGEVLLWNCGMSDILIYQDKKLYKRVPSSLLALGILKQDFKSVFKFQSNQNDHIYAYSDGITEAVNSDNEEFGQDRLEQTIVNLLTTGAGISLLTETVDQFRGSTKLFDDVTLVELSC